MQEFPRLLTDLLLNRRLKGHLLLWAMLSATMPPSPLASNVAMITDIVPMTILLVINMTLAVGVGWAFASV